jgi:hypothetical protein
MPHLHDHRDARGLQRRRGHQGSRVAFPPVASSFPWQRAPCPPGNVDDCLAGSLWEKAAATVCSRRRALSRTHVCQYLQPMLGTAWERKHTTCKTRPHDRYLLYRGKIGQAVHERTI